jgi:general secretion pathway protein H
MMDGYTMQMKNRGFTLLELMLVLVILTVASGIVVARFFRGTDQINLKASAREMSASLRYSRNQAVAERRAYAVVVAKTGYAVYTSEPAGNGGFKAVQVLKRNFPEGIFMDTATEGEVRINFFPLGDSTGGQIRLVSRNGTKVYVRVEQFTGKAKIVKG